MPKSMCTPTEPRLRNYVRERETDYIDKPHDDALVMRLDVSGNKPSRMMVNTGSLVDLLFYSILKRMEIHDSEIKGGGRHLSRESLVKPLYL